MMARPRFAKLEPDRRRRILEIAAREFAAHGYAGASLNRIIDDAGFSKGSFYYYFDDKADLFATLVRQAFERFVPPRDRFDVDTLGRDDFWPALRGLVERSHALLHQEPWLALIAKLVYSPPGGEATRAVQAEMNAAREWTADLLRRGQKVGAVRTDLPDELLLGVLFAADAAADRWLVEHWDDLEPAAVEDLTARLFAMFRSMMQPPAGPQEPGSAP